jgi:hypothetical protein
MDAIGAMKTIGANRSYLPDDVPDQVVYDAIEETTFIDTFGNPIEP